MNATTTIPIEKILEYARLAPSGDNTQPWLFQEEPGGSFGLYSNCSEEVFHEAYYSMSGTPLGLGTVLENVVIAARHFGLRTEVTYDRYLHEQHDLVARLKFVADEVGVDQQEEQLFQAMLERKTNRRPFHRRPLSPSHKEALSHIVSEAEASLFFVEGDDMLKRCGEAWGLHDDFYWDHDILRENFAKLIHFDGTATRLRTGLALRTLGLGASRYFLKPALFCARYLPFFRKIIRFQSKQTAKKLAVDSAAFGFIFLPKSPEKKVFEQGWEGTDYVRAGQVVQRLWLKATTLGLALQPAFTFVVMANNEQNSDLGDKFLTANRRMMTFLRETLPLIDTETLVFAFRIGYPKHQHVPSSPKKDVRDILQRSTQ